ALGVVLLSTEFMAVENIGVLNRVEQVLADLRASKDLPKGLQLGVTGSAAVGGDMISSAEESIQNTEVITILLVVAILLVVYRAPVLVIIPLATLIISVLVACDLVALLTQVQKIQGWEWFDFKVFKTSKIFIITILFGSGTDFCLFLIARYREELARGLKRKVALSAALANVGDAITASAATTICGLTMLFFADFGKYRNSGPAIALCLFVALIACLTLAPALLRAFGRIVFWPSGTRRRESVVEPDGVEALHGVIPASTSVGRFWAWVSRGVIARPGFILIGSVALLTPLAYQGWYTRVSYNLLAELEPGRPSVLGTDLLTQHFQPGETGPVIILAHKPGAEFDSKAGDQHIARLTKLLYDIPGVENVRSIAEPLGDVPGLANPFSPAGRLKLAAKRHRQTRSTYLSQVPQLAGDVTRFDVILDVDPFSTAAMSILDKIEDTVTNLSDDKDSPWYGVEFDFLGTTAATRDLKAVTQSDHTLIEQLVVIAVLAILMVLLRRPVICLYLVVSVLFSYLVTLGVTELAFSWWYPGFPGLDWKVPLFLFVILVAVGEDYNIYLVTRMLEEQERHGLMEGLRRAVEHTGGIITSCGVIMAGTFISMMAGTLRGMLELGFALTLGVMLDTIVVRPILVPAFLAIMYRVQQRWQRPSAAALAGADLAATPSVTGAVLPHAPPRRKDRSLTR
ncbi:MAG TPA: MMPL family transporter, partial [Pirellulales bacterium]|nr:MMPL family transporter [Pirellulales bacterium]